MVVGDGKRTNFWGDAWCGDIPFKDRFLELYDICNEQKNSVAEIANVRWRLTFRRWLHGELQDKMRELNNLVSGVTLNAEPISRSGGGQNPVNLQ